MKFYRRDGVFFSESGEKTKEVRKPYEEGTLRYGSMAGWKIYFNMIEISFYAFIKEKLSGAKHRVRYLRQKVDEK